MKSQPVSLPEAPRWTLDRNIVAPPPQSSDLEVMRALGITFGDGYYRIGGYRYGKLSDAVNYAKLKAQGIAS